ncbi:hypothetical protein MPSEU_000670900 [Mayamaea pseudoterrestris]|nr:hypothetical protein MPSEU_000670900 [Mayamaea pseudoterrestris]
MYGGRAVGKSFFNADDDSDEDDFSDEDDQEDIGGALGGGRGYNSNNSKPYTTTSSSPVASTSSSNKRGVVSSPPQQPSRPISPPLAATARSNADLLQPPTPPLGNSATVVEPNQYVGYRGISEKTKTNPRVSSEYDPTQDPSYFQQQQPIASSSNSISNSNTSMTHHRDEPPQPKQRRASRDDSEDYIPETLAPLGLNASAQDVYGGSSEQFPSTTLPHGNDEQDGYLQSNNSNDNMIPMIPNIYAASESNHQLYAPATTSKQHPATTVTESTHRTIKWLVVGLAVACVLLFALLGGIIGWQLNRRNSSNNDNASDIKNGRSPTFAPTTRGNDAIDNNNNNDKLPTLAPTFARDDITIAPTAAPSNAPTSPLFNQDLLDLISANSPLGDENLLTADTPQNLAFVATSNETSFDDTRLLQRYAMRVFYHATNGPSWIVKDGWDGNLDECLWYTTAEDPTSICESDVIQTLELSGNNVTGSLPAELSMLSSLSRLYVKGVAGSPGLTGNIPETLGNLTSMSVVVLNDHQFEGSLPGSVLTGWAGATVINIVGSGLTGTIPDAVGGLTLCSNFLLDANALTGTFPTAIGSMSSLVAFGVSNNALTGTLPALSIATVKTFSVATNLLTGALPSFAGFPAIVNLALEGNAFSGIVDTCGSTATSVSCAVVNCTCATCACV